MYNRPVRYKVNFYLDTNLGDGLKAIKDRDGVPESEQIRRGVKLWLESKDYRVTSSARKRKGGTRKR